MRMVSIGDIQLAVEERGTGKPLLMVHGFPLDHSMWKFQIDGLSSQFRVIAPDLRGFGKSDVTPGTVLMEQLADDLAKLLDALQVSEPIAFCGLSMGGYVAWQFVQRHRRRLDRLIVCDSRAVADSKEVAEGREKSAERVLAEGAKIVADTMMPKLFYRDAEGEKDFVRQTEQVMLATNVEGMAAALRGMAKRPDVTGLLGGFDVPTLVICGEHDVISPAKEMRAIAEGIPGAQYVEIAGAGHMAPLEKPAEVNAAIERFLKGG